MVRFLCISDCHNMLKNVPLIEADVLVIAGDITMKGKTSEYIQFGVDIRNIQHKFGEIWAVLGNHDFFVGNLNNTKELIGSGVKIFYSEPYYHKQSGLNFWFSSMTTNFYEWAHSRERGSDIAQEWAKIPPQTNGLVLHQPPYGYGDYVGFKRPRTKYDEENYEGRVGCRDLIKKIKSLPSVSLTVFGHIHPESGVYYDESNRLYVNAAVMNDKYKIQNKPVVVDFDGTNFTVVDYGPIPRPVISEEGLVNF